MDGHVHVSRVHQLGGLKQETGSCCVVQLSTRWADSLTREWPLHPACPPAAAR